MHYIIDGYNLLFRILSEDEGLAKRRQSVIQSLNQKIQLVGIDVLVVFDSNYRLDESTKSHYNYLEIQFTSQGKTADDWIIEAVKKAPCPEKITVVTSDKKLKKSICSLKAKGETVEDFVALLNRRYQNKLKDRPKNAANSKIILKRLLAKHAQNKNSQEGSFEYYLKAFEDNFNKIQKPKKPQKLKAKPKKHAFKEEKPEEKKYASDMERWQDLFENGF
ncbi:MAG TPA: NYN domain-containing protein [Parachlamydiaceae bacterium]|nr:NYN domain-containing protein [Parachlamydiaceae bacterium]